MSGSVCTVACVAVESCVGGAQCCVWRDCTAGKNKTRVLNSDDEIALSLKKNKGRSLEPCSMLHVCHMCVTHNAVFIFNDRGSTEAQTHKLPEVILNFLHSPELDISFLNRNLKSSTQCLNYWGGVCLRDKPSLSPSLPPSLPLSLLTSLPPSLPPSLTSFSFLSEVLVVR